MVLLWCTVPDIASAQTRLDRLDFFDKASNPLFFVTFDYDAGGRNTGRTVYMSDSTFVQRTGFVSDAAGNRTRETSFNFNDDTSGYSLFANVNSTPAVLAYDQFGLDQLGGPVSWTTTDQVNFTVLQRGAAINKVKYLIDASGNLSRIEVLDNAGGLLYYAQPTAIAAALPRTRPAHPLSARIVSAESGVCRIFLSVDIPAQVRIDQFQLSGQRIASLNKRMGSGTHALPTTSPADGATMIKLLVNGSCVDSRIVVSLRRADR